MENANPSSSTFNSEFLNPKKKIEIKSWLEDSRIVDLLVGSDEIEYFDTFPTLEKLEYHEWLLKYPKPSWVRAKMEAFNHIDFKDVNTDSIPPFVLENNNDRGKTYYSDSLTLGPEYKEDEIISKEIQHLMKLEREARKSTKEKLRRKAHLLEDKQIPSVGVFDEVFSTWMAIWREDGVAGIKRRRRDPSSDGIRELTMASGRGRLNEDLASSM
ncbi:hypothetical protein Tco_0204275 [Tanacetum coccineum]